MDNELIFDVSQQAGFRLNTLQLYNWGVLENNKLFTFNFENKSTLLTGRNGSGKTTIVDAIITLMVPKRYRLYNQSSSDNSKDKDRNEESYVLGAYGTASDDSSLSGKTKFLRDKNCISIINGLFCNEITGQEISLLQVRYFSSSELITYYGVTEQKLLVENIQDILRNEKTKLDREKKWRFVLKNKCGTEFWDSESFSKYASRFKNIFGLHEDDENKALKLFAQIVGMKELGNLNEFIRKKMIESVDVESEFQKLQTNYETLIQCEKEIEKTKCQLELLKPVVETGKNIEKSEQQKQKLNTAKDTIPCWYAQNAIAILQKEIDAKTTAQQKLETENGELQKQIETLSTEINLLSNDNGIQLVNEKKRQIKDLNDKKENIQSNRNKFEENARILNLETPNTANEFTEILNNAGLNKQNFAKNIEKLDDERYEKRKNADELNENLTYLSSELESLGTRNSNIPLKNIEIRKFITDGTGLSEKDIPFAGELIQVKQDEKEWNYAIEKLLHNFGLTLLVTERNYKKITEYVKENNLNGRVVYLRTETLLETEMPKPGKNTVLGKIDVKQDHELSKWLVQHISDKWNYLCSDDFTDISKNDKVLSSSGLIKNGIKHEKDDSIKAKKNSTNILGWNNLEKRQALSVQIDEVKKAITAEKNEIGDITTKIQELEKKCASATKILEFETFAEIDVESIIVQIQYLIEEKNQLAKENNVEDKERQINEKEGRRKNASDQKELNRETIGRIKKEIETAKHDFDKNNETWENQVKILGEEFIVNAIQQLVMDYKIEPVLFITDLNVRRDSVIRQNDNEIKNENSTYAAYIKNLGDRMRDVKSPKEEIKKKFGDWTVQFADLIEERTYLADWITHYDRLQKEELPKHQKKFKEYLHHNLNENIIGFKVFIESGNQGIISSIKILNANLKEIAYGNNPRTYLQLGISDHSDSRIKEFEQKLKNAIPNAAGYSSEEDEEKAFRKVKEFIEFVQNASERNRDLFLDLRNWHDFTANERKYDDDSEVNYYSDSNSLSGGEKAKLTYTILASAIAYQFGINDSRTKSLRFVIVDEVFSKSDSVNAMYAMQLFKQLDLQVMIVTPLDKLNIAEEYVSSVHQVQRKDNSSPSRVISLTMERFRKERAELETTKNDYT